MSTESKALRTQNNKSRKNGKGTTYFDKRRNRWVSQVINIYGVREFASFHPDLEDDAHEWRIQKVAERDGFIGSKSDFKRKTVAELLAKWLAYRSSRNRPNTNRFYSITIRTRINPKLGAIKVNRLKPEQIEIAIDELVEQGYAAGSRSPGSVEFFSPYGLLKQYFKQFNHQHPYLCFVFSTCRLQ